MNRREMIGAMGLGAAALTMTGTSARAGEAGLDEKSEQHLKVMTECAKLCNQVAHHCLEAICKKEGDIEKHARVHEMAMDTAEFCGMSACLMTRHSPLAKYAHEANAQACKDMADACDQHQDSELVKKCGEQARKCAEVCQQMAMHGHHHA
jgi:hypothetical protein